MKPNKPLPGSRALLPVVGLVAGARVTGELLDERGADTEPIHPNTHYEPADLHPKAVFLTGLGILAMVWIIVVVLYPLFNHLSHARAGGLNPAKVLDYVPPAPPAPRNESEPRTDLSDYLARQKAALSSYGWVDRSKGIVSIPIDRAMEIIAQRGIPPSKPGGTAYYPPSAGSMMTGFEGNKVKPEPR
jgi:hypothetical protein